MFRYNAGEKIFYQYLTSPCGKIVIISDIQYLRYVGFTDSKAVQWLEGKQFLLYNTDVIEHTIKELTEYFRGKLQSFSVPFLLRGTSFQEKVWKELGKIPYGKTESYSVIAARIGSPRAFRAVGMANHYNPISIIIPCHRVMNKDGSLGGYGGGIEKKAWLISHEEQCSKGQKNTKQ